MADIDLAGGNVDARLVKSEPTQCNAIHTWATQGRFIGDDTSDIRIVSGVEPANGYPLGQWAGFSGGVGGTAKGPVVDRSYTGDIAGDSYENVVMVNQCFTGWPLSQEGDSGGAVFHDTDAWGNIIARIGCFGWFGKQRLIENRFGVMTLTD